MKNLTLLISFMIFSIQCDDEKKNNSHGARSGQSSYAASRAKLLKDSGSASLLEEESAEVDCQRAMDIYSTNGTCLTPTSVFGELGSLALTPGTGPDVRVLSQAESESEGSLVSPQVEVDLGDLTASPLVGNNNFFSVYN